MSKKALGKGLSSIFEDLGTPILSHTGDFVHSVPVAQIKPNPFQPRRTFADEEIAELSQSILEKGLLQPILLRKHEDHYQIIAGERRYRATVSIGQKSIKAFIREKVSDNDMMEISLIENIQRVQLDPIEEAEAYTRLIENCAMTHEDLSTRLKKSRSAISNTLRLLNLHPAAKQLLREGKISAGHARVVLSYPSNQQADVARQIVEGNLNVRKAEELKQATSKAIPQKDPNLEAILDKIRYSLGSKVTLKGSSKKGRLIIHYYSQQELEGVFEIMESARRNSEQVG